VALTKVRFWSVVEALAKKFVAVTAPVEVRFPILPVVEKKLVDDAVVANILVEVAELPVAFTKVKFWRVEEAVARMLAEVSKLVTKALV
jgi:hypothetical protein